MNESGCAMQIFADEFGQSQDRALRTDDYGPHEELCIRLRRELLSLDESEDRDRALAEVLGSLAYARSFRKDWLSALAYIEECLAAHSRYSGDIYDFCSARTQAVRIALQLELHDTVEQNIAEILEQGSKSVPVVAAFMMEIMQMSSDPAAMNKLVIGAWRRVARQK